FAQGDPLTADLTGVVAILCAGAGDIGVAMSVRAKSVGLPINVMDDLVHSSFVFPAIVDRGDVVVAVSTGGASPVVARRVRERIEAALPARIGDLAAFIGRFRKSLHGRIGETALRRRFWQGAINRLMIEAAKSGQRAVRLKGGDPLVFGRGGEEIEALRKAGVAYSVVPGITAGLGGAAQFEVPLTYRNEALRITFLTAHKA